MDEINEAIANLEKTRKDLSRYTACDECPAGGIVQEGRTRCSPSPYSYRGDLTSNATSSLTTTKFEIAELGEKIARANELCERQKQCNKQAANDFLTKFEKTVSGNRTIMEAYRDEMTKQQTMISEFQDMLKELHYSNEEKEMAVSESSAKVEALKREMADTLDEMRAQMTAQSKAHKMEIADKNQEIQKLRNKLAELQKDYDALEDAGERRISALKRDAEKKFTETMDTLTSKVNSLNNSYSEVCQDLEAKQREVTTLLSKIADLQGELSATRRAAADSELEKNQVDKRLIEDLKRQLVAKDEALTQLEKVLTENEIKFKTLKLSLSEPSLKVERSRKPELSSSNEEVNDLKMTISELENKLKETYAVGINDIPDEMEEPHLRRMSAKLRDTEKDLHMARTALQESLADQETTFLEKNEKAFKDKDNLIDELRFSVRKLDKELNKSLSEKKEAAHSRVKLSSALESVMAEAESLAKQLKICETEKREQKKVIGRLEKALRKACVKYAALQVVVEQQEQELVNIRKQHKMEIRRLKSNLNSSSLEADLAEDKIKTLEARLNMLKTTKNDLITKTERSKNNKNKHVDFDTNSDDSLEAVLKRTEKELDYIESAATPDMKHVKRDMNDLTSDVRRLVSTGKQLMKDIDKTVAEQKTPDLSSIRRDDTSPWPDTIRVSDLNDTWDTKRYSTPKRQRPWKP